MLALKGVTMLQEVLKTRSDGELVEQTNRYLRASLESTGYFKVAVFHHIAALKKGLRKLLPLVDPHHVL